MIKFKEFDVSDAEEMEQFQNEHPDAEFLQITGGHMSREKIWFKYDDGIKQPKLSIPKHIAEELDSIWAEYISLGRSNDVWLFLWRAEEIDYKIGEKLEELFPKNQINLANIAVAYLTGKALGVELVEVED